MISKFFLKIMAPSNKHVLVAALTESVVITFICLLLPLILKILYIYPRDTRPELKMLGGASKTSVCFSSYKYININLTAGLSVVYITKFILQCDKDF